MADLDWQDEDEAVKKWLRDNGPAILTGIVVGLGAIFGWQQWQSYQQRHALEAAAEYGTFSQGLDNLEPERAREEFEQLREGYADTPYAGLAALQMARRYIDAQKPDKAEPLFRWAMDNAEPKPLQRIARVRLARMMTNIGKHEQALAVLDGAEPGAFEWLYQAIRGDAYAGLDRNEEARSAYQAALASAGETNTARRMLEMKLAQIAAPADTEGSAQGAGGEAETEPAAAGDNAQTETS